MASPRLLHTFALYLLAGISAAKQSDGVISRDVAIIGGGASGAHAAVRLREDFNKSVVVVEKKSRLVSIKEAPAAPFIPGVFI